VEIDPSFALAHAWRAIGFLGKLWSLGQREQIENGLASAERALLLDPNEAMAHYGAAVALDYLNQRDKSRFHFLRAIELNPLDVNIQGDYANLHFHEGRFDEALVLVEAILKRDPFPPVWIAFVHGAILFAKGQFRDAILAIESNNPYGYMARAYLAAANAHLGNIEEAHRYIALMTKLKPDVSFATLGAVHGFPGDQDPVVRLLFDGLRKAGFER
jgi:adenylate cyclase